MQLVLVVAGSVLLFLLVVERRGQCMQLALVAVLLLLAVGNL